jgi:hypothetical protein
VFSRHVCFLGHPSRSWTVSRSTGRPCRWSQRLGRCYHHQQGLCVRDEGHHPRRPGHDARRIRRITEEEHRRIGRYGVNVTGTVSSQRGKLDRGGGKKKRELTFSCLFRFSSPCRLCSPTPLVYAWSLYRHRLLHPRPSALGFLALPRSQLLLSYDLLPQST